MDVGVFTTLSSWAQAKRLLRLCTLYASVTMYTVCKIIFSYGRSLFHEEMLPKTFSHNHLHDTLASPLANDWMNSSERFAICLLDEILYHLRCELGGM